MGAIPAGRVYAAGMLLAVLTACEGGAAAPDGTDPGQAASPSSPATSTSPTGTATPLPDPYAGWLLPNMRSLAADDLQIERLGDRRRLRFAASLANVGSGPLVVVPRDRSGCPRGQIRVRQVVRLDADRDGTFQRRRDVERRRRPGGCMLDHPTHDHWHFDAMAAYTLAVPGTSIRVGRDKVSFCLRDNSRAPGRPRTVRQAFFGECSASTPQGISPGWVDVYPADLDGQWLRVPPRIDGRLACLTLQADPAGLLLETDETDNATSIPIRIDGTRVRRLRHGC